MANDAQMPELLPCPFCGGEARAFETQNDSEFQAQVQCSGCGAEFVFWLPWTAGYGDRSKAMGDLMLRWNHRSDLCASGQQVRALIKAGRAMADAAEPGVVASTLVSNWDNAEAALTPAPPATQEPVDVRKCQTCQGFGWIKNALNKCPDCAIPPACQQEAVPTCFACEDRPKHPNIPCAVCGAHPPQPSETVAEAMHNLICCAAPYMRDDAQMLALDNAKAALRALKGGAE